MAGPELSYEQLLLDGGIARWQEPRIGVRGHAELWVHPTRETLYTLTAIAGSARGDIWARTSVGFQAWKNVFLGPELSVYVTATYKDLRLGVHATGVELGLLNLRLSGGWDWDDDQRKGGPYIGLSAWIRL